MAFPGVDQYHGDFGGVAVALSDHFCGGAELLGGFRDGGGGAQSAQLEFEDGSGFFSRKGDCIEFAKAGPPA